jgi:hypothetical protein
MPNRAQRRAAERHALQLTAQASQVITPSAAASHTGSEQPTPSVRTLANRANSQRSTGPRTTEGKTKVSMNAVKTGLTGRLVVLPTDDAVAYQQHLDRHFSEFAPATDREKTLVQFIADTEWRLLRIAPLEAGVQALGRATCAEFVESESDPALREAKLEALVFITYQKDLHNIALQERRLRNQYKSDVVELQILQKQRLEKEQELLGARQKEVARANNVLEQARIYKTDLNLADFGFDFSVSELHAYNEKNLPYRRLSNGRNLDFDEFLSSYRLPREVAQAA